ncbi:LysR family transcriptional regulator [Nesterenkonia ebinurensis]|uniref:LysR family transcriptional regulator n=1 Tax=Nesterenkonia ebinurensis TaxID=2608252 RepID=UPI00123D4884|nr:LysR family transcriptional regulator [Nesterenkonia ebinurensis]
MDLTRLRTFRAVVAQGSVNKAAATLGYTTSAVSQQLQALQKETGLQLVERHGRGMRLTAVGRRFAEGTQPLLEQVSYATALAEDLRLGRTGSLSITHISSVGAAWMPGIVARLAQEFPELRLDLRLWELADETDDPDVEIYIEDTDRRSTSPRQSSIYESYSLLTEPYVAVLPTGHRFVDRPQISLSELENETWVDNDLTQGPCREILLDACAASGFTPAFQVETQDHATAVAFVETGVGITVMPRLSYFSARADSERVAVRELVNPTPSRTIAVRTKSSLSSNPAVQRLLALLRQVAKE